MLKQLAAGLVAMGLLATAATAQSIPYVQSPKKTFRLAHGLPPGSPYDLGAKRFAELVEVYSHGALKVDVFPSAQLGAEQATAKDVQLGTLDMAIVPTNNASMWYKPLDIFVMPFLFKDRNHVDKIVRGPVGKEMFEEYRKASGNRIISVFEWGNRALAKACGIELDVALGVMRGTAAGRGHMNTTYPDKILKGDLTPGFMIQLARKDLLLALETADDTGVPIKTGRAALDLYDLATEQGWGARDWTAMLRVVADRVAKAPKAS